MHEESGWKQRAFYLGRKWWRWWKYYDEDEVLSCLEPLYPTISRMKNWHFVKGMLWLIMMFLKQEEWDSLSLTSKHDKEFSVVIFQYIYFIIFYIIILFCLLSLDEITNFIVQSEFNFSSITFIQSMLMLGFLSSSSYLICNYRMFGRKLKIFLLKIKIWAW